MDDVRIRELNRQWRQHDKPTDVLSWPQEDTGSGAADTALPEILGDVVISLDTAARQAQCRGWDIADETALLLVHGILHLLGYEDETEAGSAAMQAIERDLLGKPLNEVKSRIAAPTG